MHTYMHRYIQCIHYTTLHTFEFGAPPGQGLAGTTALRARAEQRTPTRTPRERKWLAIKYQN